jgi:Family of unknown function (DUF5681)
MADHPSIPGSPRGSPAIPKAARKGHEAWRVIWLRAMNEKVTINENGQRRRITKQEAAIKQLANKAASGDKRAIQDMLRFQTMLFPDAPMTSSEPANSKHPPSPGRRPRQGRARDPAYSARRGRDLRSGIGRLKLGQPPSR